MSHPSDQTLVAPPTRYRRRSLFHRDEDGLTTLEWLLIVAAVAGLAALAVVLVQNVVDDTAEQIGGSSARRTAAVVAANAIMQEADRDDSSQPTGAKKYAEWKAYYTNKCDRLEITYSDAGITSTADFDNNNTSTSTTKDGDAVKAAAINTGVPDADGSGFGVLAAPAVNAAKAHCYIN